MDSAPFSPLPTKTCTQCESAQKQWQCGKSATPNIKLTLGAKEYSCLERRKALCTGQGCKAP